MKLEEKNYYIEKLNEILNSTASKLSRKDVERIVTVREGIKKGSTSKGKIMSLLGTLAKLLFHDDD